MPTFYARWYVILENIADSSLLLGLRIFAPGESRGYSKASNYAPGDVGRGYVRPSDKPLPRILVREVVRRISVSAYRLISTSNTHASNKATRIEKTMPATSQYRPPNPPASTAMPATTNGSVAI
jgi:hypothetical protein